MVKIARMGRKKLGKEKYHFTCPPELMRRFDVVAAGLGMTRSDLLIGLIRERLDFDRIAAAAPAAPPAQSGRTRPAASAPVDRRPAPARGRVSK